MTETLHHAVLRRVWGDGARARRFEFEVDNEMRFESHPGQFVSLRLGSNGSRVAHAYSIAARRTERFFELCVNVSSREPAGDAWFRSARVGQRVEFAGPFGAFRLLRSLPRISAFIAAGTGIAPLRAMVHELYRTQQPKEAWVIFGVRREADIIYRGEFERLALQHKSLHFIPTLSQPDAGWTGHHGYVQVQIEKYLIGKSGMHAYVCGPPAMVDEVRALLAALGYPPEAVSFERFG